MPELLNFQTHTDERGKLTVADRDLPFHVKRVFYIYEVPESSQRGLHRHLKNRSVMIALSGEVEIHVNDGHEKAQFTLNNPSEGLLLEPEDWHVMKEFSKNCILLILASEHYDFEDYIYEEYK